MPEARGQRLHPVFSRHQPREQRRAGRRREGSGGRSRNGQIRRARRGGSIAGDTGANRLPSRYLSAKLRIGPVLLALLWAPGNRVVVRREEGSRKNASSA